MLYIQYDTTIEGHGVKLGPAPAGKSSLVVGPPGHMSKVVRPSRATTDDVVLSDGWCDKLRIMGIPNAKKYRIRRPDSSAEATIVAVLPKNSDVQAYLADAAKRFDWKAFDEQKAAMTKIRVGQQKQRKR